ncbi:translation initiation factor IF-2-like [Canis lupus dingo]|uniref:translation initiation factor IF-2-like n=1 Tax=Canis lupus dingo TaxID=286419 RepID=UPI0020C27CD6|nr:translation initiation factor IF-2-like [Canis lupus dingo]
MTTPLPGLRALGPRGRERKDQRDGRAKREKAKPRPQRDDRLGKRPRPRPGERGQGRPRSGRGRPIVPTSPRLASPRLASEKAGKQAAPGLSGAAPQGADARLRAAARLDVPRVARSCALRGSRVRVRPRACEGGRRGRRTMGPYLGMLPGMRRRWPCRFSPGSGLPAWSPGAGTRRAPVGAAPCVGAALRGAHRADRPRCPARGWDSP